MFEDTLPKHLKKCNAAKKPRPLCHSAGVNAGLVDYHPSEEEKLPLSAFSAERVQGLIEKVKTAYKGVSSTLNSLMDAFMALADLSDMRWQSG